MRAKALGQSATQSARDSYGNLIEAEVSAGSLQGAVLIHTQRF
jgi:hypothetical protein